MKLGADPEFVMIQGEELVSAQGMLPGGMEGDIGEDHNGRVGELRPKAGTADEVVESVRGLVEKLSLSLPPGVKVKGGSYQCRQPIGGHIHFDWSNRHPREKLVKLLDSYLAVPLALIEDPIAAASRRLNYGYLGDVREQKWGFEYRTPPSWLVSQAAATTVLRLAEAIAGKEKELEPIRGPHETYGLTSQIRLLGMMDDVVKGWNQLDTPGLAQRLKHWQKMIKAGQHWQDNRNVLLTWKVAKPVEQGRVTYEVLNPVAGKVARELVERMGDEAPASFVYQYNSIFSRLQVGGLSAEQQRGWNRTWKRGMLGFSQIGLAKGRKGLTLGVSQGGLNAGEFDLLVKCLRGEYEEKVAGDVAYPPLQRTVEYTLGGAAGGGRTQAVWDYVVEPVRAWAPAEIQTVNLRNLRVTTRRGE